MTEMIERVARAIAEDIDKVGPHFTRQTWDQLSDAAKQTMYHRADAAIKAVCPGLKKRLRDEIKPYIERKDTWADIEALLEEMPE